MANDLALIKQQTADIVANRVRECQESGELNLPENYSAENAVKQAWLVLQETVDKDYKPALSVCTRGSIANALLDMIVQALNPMKKQCYFIVYGKKLTCQRSYFGNMAIAKRVDPTIKEIIAEVVYAGDTFEYDLDRGKKTITKHSQKLANVDGTKIAAAYCVLLDADGNVMNTEIMTMEEIKKAWSQSKMKPITEKGSIRVGSTHDKFTAEMAKKTVINRACKVVINSSDDSDLLIQTIRKADELNAEEELKEEIDENANQEVIDIQPEPATDQEAAPDQENENDEWTGDGEPPTEEEMAEAEQQATGTDGPGF